LKKRLEKVLGEIDNTEKSIVIIGGDFNIKIGELGRDNEGEEDRRSRDKTVGISGKNFFG